MRSAIVCCLCLMTLLGCGAKDAAPDIELLVTGDLYSAAKDGDVEKVRQLLDQGGDVGPETPDANGKPPLIFAAEGGNTEVIRVLVGNGADVNAAAADGTTPLKAAENAGNILAAQTLRDLGAKE